MPAAVTGQSYLFCERGVVPFSRAYTHTRQTRQRVCASTPPRRDHPLWRAPASEATCISQLKTAQWGFGYLRFKLQRDDSTLQPYGYGVGPIVGAAFGEDALDMAFDRILYDL